MPPDVTRREDEFEAEFDEVEEAEALREELSELLAVEGPNHA